MSLRSYKLPLDSHSEWRSQSKFQEYTYLVHKQVFKEYIYSEILTKLTVFIFFWRRCICTHRSKHSFVNYPPLLLVQCHLPSDSPARCLVYTHLLLQLILDSSTPLACSTSSTPRPPPADPISTPPRPIPPPTCLALVSTYQPISIRIIPSLDQFNIGCNQFQLVQTWIINGPNSVVASCKWIVQLWLDYVVQI